MPGTKNFENILTEAYDAASRAAVEAAKVFDEMRGPCGFAWVVISGTEPLARYCRKQLKELEIERARHGARAQIGSEEDREKMRAVNVRMLRYGDKGYPTGWQFWSPGYNGQQLDIKEAAAKAFRNRLADYGIRAEVSSRLD